MLSVQLIAKSDVSPLRLSSDGARSCYEPTQPTDDKVIDVENKNFNVGHHTVVQHSAFTFFIEGIAIGDITMGLHLYHPFYVSGQRSGRFCFGMFSDPDIPSQIADYISSIYEIEKDLLERIGDYIQNSTYFFTHYLDQATQTAADFLRAERPHVSEKYITQNAKKIAQEQLRMFIPVIFPTGVQFSANLYTVAAMYRTAWSPVMKKVTEMMVEEIIKLYPELQFMFQRRQSCFEPIIPEFIGARQSPDCSLIAIDDSDTSIMGTPEEMFPFDTLQFDPCFMVNNTLDITSEVEISLATMGQDQRHRMVRRSLFHFTGNVYCPPILYQLGLEDHLSQTMRNWLNLVDYVSDVFLSASLAPYGAMVRYKKKANLNAFMHEQGKRTCWCAQEEIYNLARKLRQSISSEVVDSTRKDELLTVLSPPCFQTGICGEGGRYCGRDLAAPHSDYFPARKV